MTPRRLAPLLLFSLLLSVGAAAQSQKKDEAKKQAPPTRYQCEPAPDRTEGEGPFRRLVIRGATLINGAGAPPQGPMDIVIENDRIVDIVPVGYPKVAIDPADRPVGGDHEIDAHGMYVLPGFVDAHAHIATPGHGTVGDMPPAEYVYKLWLGHGVTTVREVGSFNGLGLDRGRSSIGSAAAADRDHGAPAWCPTQHVSRRSRHGSEDAARELGSQPSPARAPTA